MLAARCGLALLGVRAQRSGYEHLRYLPALEVGGFHCVDPRRAGVEAVYPRIREFIRKHAWSVVTTAATSTPAAFHN